MMKATIRWALFFAALLALGPALYLLTSALRGADGVSPTSPGPAGTGGILRGVIVVVVLAGAGMGVARLTTLRWGMFVAGVAGAWAAAGVASLAEVVRTSPQPPMNALALEGFLLGGLMALGVWGMHWAASRRPGAEHDAALVGWRGAGDHATYARSHEGWVARVGLVDLVVCVLVAVAAGMIVPALAAQTGLKGQVVAAAVLSGLAAATIGTFASRRWGFSPLGTAAGIAVVAGLAPLVAGMMTQSGALVKMANAGSLLPAARALPLDWIAGMLVGIPLGLAWGQSLSGTKLTHSDAAPAAAATR